MATLNITVQYSAGVYSYDLSFTDNGTDYTSTVADEGSVSFINGTAGTDARGAGSTGQYTLTDATTGNSQTFTFDAVLVRPGSGLGESKTCDECRDFSLGSIPFPAIAAGATSRSDGWSWCQSLREAAQAAQVVQVEGAPKFTDPKLGLTNTTGSEPVNASFTPCECGRCG